MLSQVAYSREGFSATNSHSQAGANAMSDAELVDMFDHVDVANGAVQCSAVQCSQCLLSYGCILSCVPLPSARTQLTL